MKHFILVQVGPSLRLYDHEARPVDLFNRFTEDMRLRSRHADSTQKGYSEHVANSLDYLYELGLLDVMNPPSPENFTRALNDYPTFLEDAQHCTDPVLAEVAVRLGRSPISKVSCQKHCSALNKFTSLCERHVKQERELKTALGLNLETQYTILGQPELVERRPLESFRMRQNSIISGNIMGTKLKATKRKPRVSTNPPAPTFEGKDFPRSRLQATLNLITNTRERLLATMVAAGGLRFSEAIQIRRSDVDLVNRTISVNDPNGARRPITEKARRMPFKGRRTSKVYLIHPLRDWLFELIELYLEERPQVLEGDYLFLHDNVEKYGIPMCTSTPMKTLNKSFNSAFKKSQVKQAALTGCDRAHLFTLHSLRHFYAMWLKNCVRVKGKKKLGLEIYQIQRLMGHRLLTTTMRYCHDDQDIVDMLMEASDLRMEHPDNIIDLDEHYADTLIKHGNYLKSEKPSSQYRLPNQ